MIRLVCLGSSGATPTKASIPSCFAVKFGATYLFDCAEGAQQNMMKYGLSYLKCPAIFLSHLHADHVLGLFPLIQTMNLFGRTEPLRIYGPTGTREFLTAAFALKPMRPAFPVLVEDIDWAGKPIAKAALPVFESDLFWVKAFPVEHGCPALGYVLEEKGHRRFDLKKAKAKGVEGRFFTEIQTKGSATIKGKLVKYEQVSYLQEGKKIVYTGDTMPTKRIEKEAKGAAVLVMDSCFHSDEGDLAKDKKHGTSGACAKTAKKAKVDKLVLTHISNRYDEREPLLKDAQKTFPNTVMAIEGLEILL
jgi:ribonuclease Z